MIDEPPTEPTPIEYRRWRHKTRAYLVEVVRTQNFRGKHGYYTVVYVEQKGKEKGASWPASTFLRLFEPVGRKMHRKSRYDRLME